MTAHERAAMMVQEIAVGKKFLWGKSFCGEKVSVATPRHIPTDLQKSFCYGSVTTGSSITRLTVIDSWPPSALETVFLAQASSPNRHIFILFCFMFCFMHHGYQSRGVDIKVEGENRMKYHVIIADMSASETNEMVRDYFKEHPKLRGTATIDEVASAIGRPKGSIGKTTTWKSIMEERNDDKERTRAKVIEQGTPEPESYGRYLELRKDERQKAATRDSTNPSMI